MLKLQAQVRNLLIVRGDVAGAVPYGRFPRVEGCLELPHGSLELGRASARRHELGLEVLHQVPQISLRPGA
ncbi:MAG: hypothetical protein ACREJV_02750 [Candidatus Rokuibacteriota bacterium]